MDWLSGLITTAKNDPGTKLGLLAAFLKMMQCIKDYKRRRINWVNVLVMIPSTVLMGHVAWKITAGQDIAELIRLIFTFYISINTFMVLEFIQNPKLLEAVFETFAPIKGGKNEKGGDK